MRIVGSAPLREDMGEYTAGGRAVAMRWHIHVLHVLLTLHERGITHTSFNMKI